MHVKCLWEAARAAAVSLLINYNTRKNAEDPEMRQSNLRGSL